METFFIIIAVIVIAVAAYFFNEILKAKRGQAVLSEMASAYATFRSEGKTVEEAEIAIYEKFDVPCPSYSGTFLVDQRRNEMAEENPVLFEFLTIREMAFTVHYWHKFIPRPSTTYPIFNEINRNLSISDFCRYLSKAISAAEGQGLSPPQSLKEIADREKEITAELPDSKIYLEWRDYHYFIVPIFFLDSK